MLFWPRAVNLHLHTPRSLLECFGRGILQLSLFWERRSVTDGDITFCVLAAHTFNQAFCFQIDFSQDYYRRRLIDSSVCLQIEFAFSATWSCLTSRRWVGNLTGGGRVFVILALSTSLMWVSTLPVTLLLSDPDRVGDLCLPRSAHTFRLSRAGKWQKLIFCPTFHAGSITLINLPMLVSRCVH